MSMLRSIWYELDNKHRHSSLYLRAYLLQSTVEIILHLVFFRSLVSNGSGSVFPDSEPIDWMQPTMAPYFELSVLFKKVSYYHIESDARDHCCWVFARLNPYKKLWDRRRSFAVICLDLGGACMIPLIVRLVADLSFHHQFGQNLGFPFQDEAGGCALAKKLDFCSKKVGPGNLLPDE